MTWTHNSTNFDVIPEGQIGFVYLITNLTNGMKYIGKKNFYSTKTSQKTIVLKTTGLKKKKKIRTKIESDWRDYFGSSDELRSDVEKLGKENFTREILHLCKTKGEISYFEAKLQFEYDVLLYPEKFYNKWIMVRVHRTHLKLK